MRRHPDLPKEVVAKAINWLEHARALFIAVNFATRWQEFFPSIDSSSVGDLVEYLELLDRLVLIPGAIIMAPCTLFDRALAFVSSGQRLDEVSFELVVGIVAGDDSRDVDVQFCKKVLWPVAIELQRTSKH